MAEFEVIKSKIKLRDIKSSYILKIIFLFLNEKQKLKIIVYSKELQKMCLIGIEDYKKIRNIYKIGGKSGEGKEYIINANILTFEGEYLNGKKNGKGKEYFDNGNIKFDGEYLNGKIWNGNGYNINGNMEFKIEDGRGNINEYEYNGKIAFEGEYLNGERNGKGKEYDIFEGKLEFEGEYLNGERIGKGKEYYNNKLVFEGQYLNGRRNGKGKEYYSNSNIKFDGEYLNGAIWNGNGYNINGNMEFEIKDRKGNIKQYNNIHLCN